MVESQNKWWMIGGVAALVVSAAVLYKLSSEDTNIPAEAVEEKVNILESKDTMLEALKAAEIGTVKMDKEWLEPNYFLSLL
jgi:hypothetical protein